MTGLLVSPERNINVYISTSELSGKKLRKARLIFLNALLPERRSMEEHDAA